MRNKLSEFTIATAQSLGGIAKLRLLLLLGAFVSFGFALLSFRITYTGTIVGMFLYWNLFLAAVPLIISSLLLAVPQRHKNRLLILFFSVSWLVFLPNAPYILTDLFHLHNLPDMPKWFDLLLICTFAGSGLFMGLISIADMQQIFSKFFGKKVSWAIIIIAIFLSAFGVYLGRFQRWNSWDILQDPFSLLSDITAPFLAPWDHQYTWGLIIGLGSFLLLAYLTFISVFRQNLGGSKGL